MSAENRKGLSLRLTTAAAVVAMVAIAAPDTARAEPRFALREGVPCSTCHVSPSGGGMRNRHGRYVYGPTALPAGYPSGDNPLMDLDVGDSLSFGADLRLLYLEQPNAGLSDSSRSVRTFMPMQADFYIAATPFEGLTLYYDQGIRESFEATIMYEHDLGVPELSFYSRAGFFAPPYGLRTANHNLFIRQEIGFGPGDNDAGLEVGFQLGPILLQGAVLTGAGAQALIDDNTDKAFVGRLEGIFRIDDFRLMLGGSFYTNRTGNVTTLRDSTIDTRTDHMRVGGHMGMAIGRFAWLGEADLVFDDPTPDNTSGETVHAFRSYQQLDVRIVRGFELRIDYEYRQRNLDLRNGVAHRIGGGFSFFPLPNLELFFLYRYIIGNGTAEAEQDGFQEIIAIIHGYL